MSDKKEIQVNLDTLFPVIAEKLSLGGEVIFKPRGISMLPLVRPGIDSVYLKAPPETLKKYDLPLYKRESGQFVLHRVVKVTPEGYVMCGDNQHFYEKYVKHSQIIGIVTKIEKDNKIINCDDEEYMKYVKKRVAYQRGINIKVRIKGKLKRIIKKIGGKN